MIKYYSHITGACPRVTKSGGGGRKNWVTFFCCFLYVFLEMSENMTFHNRKYGSMPKITMSKFFLFFKF